MTIKELIDLLSKYPPDTVVECINSITEEGIWLAGAPDPVETEEGILL
jgi:hypothetical protein